MTTAGHCNGHSERYNTCKASLVSAEMASDSRSAMALQTSCDLIRATHVGRRYKMMEQLLQPKASGTATQTLDVADPVPQLITW